MRVPWQVPTPIPSVPSCQLCGGHGQRSTSAGSSRLLSDPAEGTGIFKRGSYPLGLSWLLLLLFLGVCISFIPLCVSASLCSAQVYPFVEGLLCEVTVAQWGRLPFSPPFLVEVSSAFWVLYLYHLGTPWQSPPEVSSILLLPAASPAQSRPVCLLSSLLSLQGPQQHFFP